MPRAVGQIDETKTEAILQAATELLAEKGATVSMDQIARRAGVSRQTLYNRFPSKLEISRAVMARRADVITAPLREGKGTRETLERFAYSLISTVHSLDARQSLRAVALVTPELPELGLAVYDAGPLAGLQQLALWLKDQSSQGHLAITNPDLAAEVFVGMAQGHGHLRTLLGVSHPPIDMEAKAAEVAGRFVKAYAPEG